MNALAMCRQTLVLIGTLTNFSEACLSTLLTRSLFPGTPALCPKMSLWTQARSAGDLTREQLAERQDNDEELHEKLRHLWQQHADRADVCLRYGEHLVISDDEHHKTPPQTQASLAACAVREGPALLN